MKIIKLFIIYSFFLFIPYSYASTVYLGLTEEYPPFNMKEFGKIVGISTEIVEEMFKRTKLKLTIESKPWIRAYRMALDEKDAFIFSTTRTPEREKLFKWVGPLVENEWAFFAKEGSKIKITNLDDARKFTVGGYHGDAVSEYLISKGFIEGKNIILAANEEQNAFKLNSDRINLWATGSKLAPWMVQKAQIGKVTKLYEFKKEKLYAAFNLNTSDAVINSLKKALNEMQKDKTIEKISKHYLNPKTR